VCVRLPAAGSGGLAAVQPLLLANLLRIVRAPEMGSTLSLIPCTCM
jgi:hypothetical protein